MNVHDSSNGENHTCLKLNYMHHRYSNPDAAAFSKVLCVDGIFHFVRKTIWEEIRYDEYSFSGFHFYDVDFSFAVAEKYNNYVLLDFDVFHDSHGYINAEYIKDMFIFQNKWKNKLPKSVNNRANNITAELKETFTIFMLCIKKRVSLKKYWGQIYRINKFPLFVLILFYIPIRIVIKLFYRVVGRVSKTQGIR